MQGPAGLYGAQAQAAAQQAEQPPATPTRSHQAMLQCPLAGGRIGLRVGQWLARHLGIKVLPGPGITGVGLGGWHVIKDEAFARARIPFAGRGHDSLSPISQSRAASMRMWGSGAPLSRGRGRKAVKSKP